MPRSTKRKVKPRPPRIFKTSKGRYYIKVGRKRVYLRIPKTTNKQRLTDKDLIKLVLEKFLKTRKPRRSYKPREKVIKSDFVNLEVQNRTQAIRELVDKARVDKFRKLAELEKAELDSKKAQEKIDAERLKADRAKAVLAIEQKRIDKQQKDLLQILSQPPKLSIEGKTPEKKEVKIKFRGKEYTLEEADKLATDLLKDSETKTSELEKLNQELDNTRHTTQTIRRENVNTRINAIKPIKPLASLVFEEAHSSKGAWASRTRKKIKKLLTDEDIKAVANLKGTELRNALRPILQERVREIPKGERKDTVNALLESESKGSGKTKNGLTNMEINDFMSKYKWFLGTCSSDNLHTVKFKKGKFSACIMNLDSSDGPGTHWVAVAITPDSILYYDPLADHPPKGFYRQIKAIIDRMKPSTYLKVKINKIKHQSSTTDTCGFHAMHFLVEQAKGNTWKFSTGFTDLKEKEIMKFKKQNGYGFM